MALVSFCRYPDPYRLKRIRPNDTDPDPKHWCTLYTIMCIFTLLCALVHFYTYYVSLSTLFTVERLLLCILLYYTYYIFILL